MTDDRIRRFLQRTAGATTGLGPRSTFRPTHATQSPQPTPATELGTEGDYELAEILGRGGMGVVYRARQPRLDRTVAVKTIRPEIGSDAAVASFICEARVTGHLAHPNIVPVIDIGRSSVGDTFLAMKLVEGQSWEELLADDGPVAESLFMDLDDDTAFPDSALQDLPMRVGSELEPHLEIFLSVCNAIAFAHSRGFIHRDIKPTNVMLGEFGEVLVMDWGLAVDIADERREGRPSIVHKSEVKEPWGTPCYLAPEMAEGDGESLGPWTDVFLLGATLHEVVTRRPPHAGTNFKRILEAARTASPPSYPDEVPAELQGILQRAMAKDPMDRFPSVLALRDALRGFQKHGESTRLTEAARSAAH
ncbi:MAG: serine/threonine protein kinase, partial [Planctomycetes bacterium]|nr:serine/threonine protein kinase [Planctomycetota bacterium]